MKIKINKCGLETKHTNLVKLVYGVGQHMTTIVYQPNMPQISIVGLRSSINIGQQLFHNKLAKSQDRWLFFIFFKQRLDSAFRPATILLTVTKPWTDSCRA
jgi:hypothetical protein